MVKKDIYRLVYTISNGNKPNEADINALNGVIEYVNKEKERQLNDHHLFAKLYISRFKSEMKRRNGNYQMVADDLRRDIAIDVMSHLELFHQDMNMIEFGKLTDRLGMSSKHPALVTEEENENDKRIINENAKEITEVMTHFNKEDVINRIEIVMNNLIEDYG